MKTSLVLGSALLCLSFAASAGPFNDKLAICLVKETTDADKSVLMRWIFSAMASHPDVQDLGRVSAAQGDAHNKAAAELFVALLSKRCREESKDAVKYEGATAINSSFEVLGKVAMQGLMADPQVSKYMGGVDAHVDADAMKDLFPTEAAKP